MSYSGHVQTKHEIEYGGSHFNWESDLLRDWLADNGVQVCGCDNAYGDCAEWELSKDELRAIPEDAYKDVNMRSSGSDYVIEADEFRDFVQECLDAPTGDWAYVSWF